MLTVRLLKGKEVSLLRRHRWVFSGAVAPGQELPANGETVRVEDAGGRFLGQGHWHHGSIAIRIISFGQQPIDAAFWSDRLSEALSVRMACGLPNTQTDCFRLVHGEGDGLPGLVVDIYGKTAVVQTHSTGMALAAEEIAAALTGLNTLPIGTIYLRDLANGTARHLLGEASGCEVTEHGRRFHVNWVEGQKTGFFLDQRGNRLLLAELAKGRKVLNTFCYTGGFSVYAMTAGAARVVSVDASGPAMALASTNVALNCEDADARHEAVVTDAFKFLENARDFDLMILDPPAFAKGMKARHRAVQGYKRLNELALRSIEPNGLILTFSCSQVVSPELFEKTVLSAAINAGREVRVLQRLGHRPDHPVSIFHPEGEYLKGLLLSVS